VLESSINPAASILHNATERNSLLTLLLAFSALDFIEPLLDLGLASGILRMEISASFQGVRKAVHVGDLALNIVGVLITFAVAETFIRPVGAFRMRNGTGSLRFCAHLRRGAVGGVDRVRF
jgi:hypothetical protein